MSALSSRGVVWQGAALLRAGLRRSPFNFKLKLLLFLHILELGNFDGAWKLWCSLNVRHIQWDTLVYLVLPTAARSCHATAASELCSSAATLYQENERDVPEQIVNAYKHNYSNVLDFVHLQTKLRQSYGKLHVSRHDVAALAFGPPGRCCRLSILVADRPRRPRCW